jgi:UDP-N-acetylglucosamine--N-acetylmuramyl-(pentapeptide) pyrophosphoryl-undecaprenol N-acetylglucosamine transferase
VIGSGGGTGGHIYPAMAIAKGLLERLNDIEVLYVGTGEGMESRLVPENGLLFKGISGKGLPRKLSTETIKTAGSNIKALWETKQVLKEFKPDLEVGTGGYGSVLYSFTSAYLEFQHCCMNTCTSGKNQSFYPGSLRSHVDFSRE